jgi:hypothetical protein
MEEPERSHRYPSTCEFSSASRIAGVFQPMFNRSMHPKNLGTASENSGATVFRMQKHKVKASTIGCLHRGFTFNLVC